MGLDRTWRVTVSRASARRRPSVKVTWNLSERVVSHLLETVWFFRNKNGGCAYFDASANRDTSPVWKNSRALRTAGPHRRRLTTVR